MKTTQVRVGENSQSADAGKGLRQLFGGGTLETINSMGVGTAPRQPHSRHVPNANIAQGPPQMWRVETGPVGYLRLIRWGPIWFRLEKNPLMGKA